MVVLAVAFVRRLYLSLKVYFYTVVISKTLARRLQPHCHCPTLIDLLLSSSQLKTPRWEGESTGMIPITQPIEE